MSSDKKIWYKQDQQQRRQQASLEEPFVEDLDAVSNPTKKDARTSTRATTGLLDTKEEEDGSKENSLFRDSADSIRSTKQVMDPLLNKFLQRGGNLSDTFSGTATVLSSGLSTNRTLVEPSKTWLPGV